MFGDRKSRKPIEEVLKAWNANDGEEESSSPQPKGRESQVPLISQDDVPNVQLPNSTGDESMSPLVTADTRQAPVLITQDHEDEPRDLQISPRLSEIRIPSAGRKDSRTFNIPKGRPRDRKSVDAAAAEKRHSRPLNVVGLGDGAPEETGSEDISVPVPIRLSISEKTPVGPRRVFMDAQNKAAQKAPLIPGGPAAQDGQDGKQAAENMLRWQRRNILGKKGPKTTIAKDVKHQMILDMQVDRALIEIPRPMRLHLYSEAYPIVLKTVQIYHSQLGDKHPITVHAVEHLRELAKVLGHKCEY
eukprot:Colp12_sorted_trinity150504_noHs@25678